MVIYPIQIVGYKGGKDKRLRGVNNLEFHHRPPQIPTDRKPRE
jgi:hypothetical protein